MKHWWWAVFAHSSHLLDSSCCTLAWMNAILFSFGIRQSTGNFGLIFIFFLWRLKSSGMSSKSSVKSYWKIFNLVNRPIQLKSQGKAKRGEWIYTFASASNLSNKSPRYLLFCACVSNISQDNLTRPFTGLYLGPTSLISLRDETGERFRSATVNSITTLGSAGCLSPI